MKVNIYRGLYIEASAKVSLKQKKVFEMIRFAYRKMLDWADHKYAQIILCLTALTESIFFPIPPDILLIPMVIANRRKAWLYASLTTIMNMVGAAIGYYIGAALFHSIGQPLIEFYHYQQVFESFQMLYHKWGVVLLLTAALTPIPFKVFTIGSGFIGLPFILFMLVSSMGRAFRFFLISMLLYKYGNGMKIFIEKHLTCLFLLFIALLIGGFIIMGYM